MFECFGRRTTPSCLPGFRSVWGLISCLQMNIGWMGVCSVHCRGYWGLQLCNPKISSSKVITHSADLRSASPLCWEKTPAEKLGAVFPYTIMQMSSFTELTHAAGKTCTQGHSCLRCPFSVSGTSCSWEVLSLTLFMVSHLKSSQQRQKNLSFLFTTM